MSANYSLSVFSQGGRIPQVNHAIANVNNHGKLVVGIKAHNGLVVARECKPNSDLIIIGNDVIRIITDYIAVAYSGIDSDFDAVIASILKIAENYLAKYGEAPPVKIVANWISRSLRHATQAGGRRVSAINVTVAGWDYRGPFMYGILPDGTISTYKGGASGVNSANAVNRIKRSIQNDLDVEDAVGIALSAIRESLEGEVTAKYLRIAVSKGPYSMEIMSFEDTEAYIKSLDT